MANSRIGLIGGISWESTAEYYRLLNQLVDKSAGPHTQPEVVIDSQNFEVNVALQRAQDWDACNEIYIDAAKRLESAGATVLGLCANTAHRGFEVVQASVSIPMIDIRVAMAQEVKSMGETSMALLGTKPTMATNHYSSRLEELGVKVVKPTNEEMDDLQRIIFDELTLGVFTDSSRQRFIDIAENCVNQGAGVVGLCCTEFGLLLNGHTTSFRTIDSVAAHVRALLLVSEFRTDSSHAGLITE